MTRQKNWKAYAKTSFNNMRSNVDDWGNPDFFRPITRTFYINVFDCAGINHTGLISEDAINYPHLRTHDHCLSPQFVGRMIMDNPDLYLQDYSVFEELFWISCSTITVTKNENKQLSMLTKNDGMCYTVYVPTDKKYDHLGINLFKRPPNSVRWEDAADYSSGFIDVPKDLLKYEKNFLVGTLENFLG